MFIIIKIYSRKDPSDKTMYPIIFFFKIKVNFNGIGKSEMV